MRLAFWSNFLNYERKLYIDFNLKISVKTNGLTKNVGVTSVLIKQLNVVLFILCFIITKQFIPLTLYQRTRLYYSVISTNAESAKRHRCGCVSVRECCCEPTTKSVVKASLAGKAKSIIPYNNKVIYNTHSILTHATILSCHFDRSGEISRKGGINYFLPVDVRHRTENEIT